ncbi:MAG: hypothetical protein EAZ21_09900 [Betaproteobacteria bacterium]|nr:MAG: hypothetical protein EAZ21_09900 [Betaproteobacteria bacterium]
MTGGEIFLALIIGGLIFYFFFATKAEEERVRELKVQQSREEYELAFRTEHEPLNTLIDTMKQNLRLMGVSEREIRYGDQIQVSGSFRVTYTDAHYQTNARVIDAKLLDYDSNLKLHAYCHLRHEERTFYVDKMRDVTSVETGELIEDLEHHLLENAKRI